MHIGKNTISRLSFLQLNISEKGLQKSSENSLILRNMNSSVNERHKTEW